MPRKKVLRSKNDSDLKETTLLASAVSEIPQYARNLASIGDKTNAAVRELFTLTLFSPSDNEEFIELAYTLNKLHWQDTEAAQLIQAYGNAIESGRRIDVSTINRWVLVHNDIRTVNAVDAVDAVLACINVEPPDEVDIISALPRRGSQKIVFLAKWQKRLDVVLKKVIGPAESAVRIQSREMGSHPLNLRHHNIIETYSHKNSRGEVFFIEKRLSDVLDDNRHSEGIVDAANLLVDIGRAIKYLHDHDFVHGDIKPDNIGKDGNNYVLLDFGICRRIRDFTDEATPTGSLRTRAPELLLNKHITSPAKLDVWALGATIYNFCCHRFPLIQSSEKVPRISSLDDRKKFEKELAERVMNKWEKYVDLSKVPVPLKGLIQDMLAFDPVSRPTAASIVSRAEKELAAFLRSSATVGGHFSPFQELEQIERFIRDELFLRYLPQDKREQLKTRLHEMKAIPGFDSHVASKIAHLITELN